MIKLGIEIDDDKRLGDGVYNIENIPYVYFNGEFDGDGISLYDKKEKKAEIKEFIQENPDFYVALAYECGTGFFLASKPEKCTDSSGQCYGGTFRVGNILVVLEND